MKAEEQTLLNGILSTIFKLDGESLSKLYNVDGELTDLSIVMDADTKRVAKFNTEKTAQLNRGIKEGAEKIEKAIKEKYGDSDLIGVELVESVVSKQVVEASKDSGKDISKHPEYVKLQASINEKMTAKDKEWEGKLKEKEAGFYKEQLLNEVEQIAFVKFDSRKPILPEDPRKAQAWKDTYKREIRSGNFQKDDNGNIIVLNKDGKIMEDEHGHAITFDEFEKSISDRYFEYPKAEQRSGSGNQPPAGSGSNGEPKTKADCVTKLKDPKITPEDRKKFTELMDTLKT